MPTRREASGWQTDRIQYRIRCVYQGDPATEEEVLENISRERFIRLGTALGVGATCASLVACGGGAGSSGGGGSGGGNAGGGNSGGGGDSGGSKKSSGGGTKAGGTAIVSESEVAPGSAHEFEDSGNPAVLVHLDNGTFVAYSAVCTHQGCDVAYKNGNLVCPCHGSVFDPADGAAVIAGPAQRPLPEIPVKVEGGEVVRA
jgi:nitrite reductase/ring-hydroxylating ferredoxin subunit